MTSRYKGATEIIPPSFLGESTEEKARLFKQLASLDNTRRSTRTTKNKSAPMLSSVIPDEKTRGHAMLARVALLSLERAGLCRRYRVLSKGVVKEIRVVFSPEIWAEDLRLLSEAK